MNALGEKEQVHLVAYALDELINRAINKLQAYVAFSDFYPQRANMSMKDDWYALAHSSILENLLVDIASMTDRAKHHTKESFDTNCNFRELRYVLTYCENDSQKYQSVIQEIDSFLNTYDNVVPDILRNKVLAHKDLDELFAWRDYNVNLIEITRFLIEGKKIISDTLEVKFGVHMIIPDFESIKNKYVESLKKPL